MSSADARPLVVVGAGGSPAADAALRWAVEYALDIGETGADVLAIAVWQSRFRFADPALPGGTSSDITRRLPADVRVRAARGRIRLRGELALGDPADVLLRRSRDAALLVLGNSGRNPVVVALVGSVLHRCQRGAACPVVAVPAPLLRS